jgi:hypothetical protein
MMSRNNKEVLDAIAVLSAQVQRIADALEKQSERKSYQAEYYQKRKKKAEEAAALAAKLDNQNRHCLEGMRDTRLPYAQWAAKLKEFAERGLSAYNFISWLAWAWNHDTYKMVPITKSGGYFHVFIGLSGKNPLRSKYSERDVTGHMRVARLTNKVQIDTFADALFWKWSFRTVATVVNHAQDEGWFEGLGESWNRPLKVAMGSTGQYEVEEKGRCFDPNERDIEVASYMYGRLRPTLEMNWNAFRRGLSSKEEPFTAAK